MLGKLLGVVIVIVGVFAAWFILGGIAQSLRSSLRSRKGSRGFLFWLAVGIGIAGVFIIAHWLLSSSGGVMMMH